MEIKRIGIAGAGTMGYSMADIFASYGFDVTLWNHRKPTLERAKTLISETSRDKIHYTTNLEDIAHLDIVIENVTEDMAIKEGFYESFCKMADADMILTFYHVSSYLMKDLDDSHEIPTLLKEHYEKGELGVKTKKGFYDYSNGKDKEATERRNEKLLKVFNVLYKTL